MFKIWLGYQIVILLIGVLFCKCEYKLELVQMVYRHGARAPIITYPNDPNPASLWKAGLGKLTLQGKRQHYSLGLLFRLMYNDFITTSPTEIKVRSSAAERCINSAAANLASFYAPKENWLLYSNLNWQPIPIYLLSPSGKYLNPAAKCPKVEKTEQKIRNSLYAAHKDLSDHLTFYSGLPIKDFITLRILLDTLKVEKMNNLIIPAWVGQYQDEIDEIEKNIYVPYKNPEIQYFRGGPLLGLIVDSMKEKVFGNLPELKVQVFSTHDVGLAAVLACLNHLPNETVPYASTIIFELYSAPNEKNLVRLLYFNSTEPERVVQKPHILIIEGCQEFCPLDYFVEYTKNRIPKNWTEECKLSP